MGHKIMIIKRRTHINPFLGRYAFLVLAGNEDEIELTLMNKFDQSFRRNQTFAHYKQIFSEARKCAW